MRHAEKNFKLHGRFGGKSLRSAILILYENVLISWWKYYLCALCPLDETRNIRHS